MNRITITTLAFCFILMIVLCSSCAYEHPEIKHCIEGHTYGFWGGLWHGFIAPITFIIGWFNSDVSVWSANNNGGWYTFGFLLGVGALTYSSSKTTNKS